jgi:hypothetical protein
VGLNTAFATIFTLKQTENQIDYLANIKTPIKPKYILGIYYLIFTPIDLIKTILDKNTTCLETISGSTKFAKFWLIKKKFLVFNIYLLKMGLKLSFIIAKEIWI